MRELRHVVYFGLPILVLWKNKEETFKLRNLETIRFKHFIVSNVSPLYGIYMYIGQMDIAICT